MKNSLKTVSVNNERNYGIDLLRIVSMMMIVTLHVLYQGGILENISVSSLRFGTVWLLEIMCLCSVNCYGLISGYVGYGRKFKFANIINLWFEVVFYNITINAVFFILYKLKFFSTFMGEFSENIILPLTKGTYWYFTAYFFMSFFIPLFNFILQELSKKRMTYILLTMIGIFSIFYAFFFGRQIDVFLLGNGYNILWLSALYLIGAYAKKYGFLKNIKKYKCVFIFLINSILLLICKFLEANKISVSWFHYSLFSYNNLLHLINGIMLLIFFSKLKLNHIITNFTKFFAPVTFGVYIIHLHPILWKWLEWRFVSYTQYFHPLMIAAIIVTVLIIWLVCSLVDRIRLFIFAIFKVKKYCVKIENTAQKLFGKLYDKYFF